MTKKSSKLVGCLIKAGLPKNAAKSLAVVLDSSTIRAVDIERVTDLRQPEVSIAMQDLRNRGWINKKDIKKEGKGRPTHSYSLAIPAKEIFNEISKAEEKRINEAKDNLSTLKTLLK